MPQRLERAGEKTLDKTWVVKVLSLVPSSHQSNQQGLPIWVRTTIQVQNSLTFSTECVIIRLYGIQNKVHSFVVEI